MQKNSSSSQSGALHPRVLAALLLCGAAMFCGIESFAATPDHGTLTDTSGPVKYSAGPFTTSNPTPIIEVDNGPECGTGQPCDDYKLTVSLPSGFIATHPNAAIKATMSWTDSGAGASDYDLYIYKTPRSDCSPNDCTATDGSQQANGQSASGANPEVATLAVTSDSSTYTIVVVPYTASGETVHVTIEFLGGNAVAVDPNAGTSDPNFGRADASAPGVPRFMNFYAPAGTSAEESSGEFNIGFNPKTGRIMTMNAGPVWRITPPELLKAAKPECCEGLWENKSDRTTDFGLDPILWTDQVTGRTFVSNSTAGANAVYAYTDNDGDTYTEGGISPPNGGADHQTIGSGPYPAALAALGTPVNQGRAVYYCSQDVVGPAACQRSDTLGASYGPGVLAYNGQGTSTPGGTDCGGLHGHLHVAPDGTVWLPVNQCNGKQGGAYSTDGGTTWNEFIVPGAISQANGADPSIAIDSDSNIYYSYVNNEPVAKGQPPEGHARVVVGKLDLAKNTITWGTNFDLGTTHNIKNAAEIEAVGGSSGRAGVGFIGTNIPGDYQALAFPGRWYAFIATTYDRGQSWVTVNATPNDPVQSKTGVWQQGGGAQDRNLLDFDEITVDDKGRVLFGYSDGCVSATCIDGSGGNDFVAYMRVARQTGGKSLFAKNDINTDTTAPILAKAPCLSGTRDITGSHLTWKAPDDGGSAITDYYVYRGKTSGGEDVAPLGHTRGRTSFQDTTADPTVTDYFYIVKAVTSVGFGAPSNEVDLKVTAPATAALPYSCSGVNVVTDFAGDAKDPAPNFELANADQADITAISFGAAKGVLTTKMTVKNLTLTPSAGTTETYYYVVWTGPDGKQYATEAVEPDPSGSFAFSYGLWDDGNKRLASGSHATTGTTTTGPNGTITVDVPLTAVGNPTIPVPSPTDIPAVRQPFGLTIAGAGILGSGLVFTAPMDRAPNIDIGFGQSWAVCLPANTAPTAVLNGSPQHGPAPLTVTFDGSGSTDPDVGDTIASYTFEFGDGSNPVTQSSPTIQHTYSAAGEYNARLTVTDSHGLVSLNSALVPIEVNAVLRNISTRGNVQAGDNVLIGGFIVTGNDPRNIVLRAIGPSIKSGGQPLAGTLQDPTLELHDSSGAIVATNDNWKTDDANGQSQQTAIEGTGIPPSDDRESAIVRTLAPGKYTAIVRGKGGATGLALVEAYDLNPFATSKLANISTRSFVGVGDNVMIGGFVAGPSTAAPATVLIRGIGPSMTAQAVPDTLQDPTLELHDGNGTLLRANDNWQDSQAADIQATGIAPTDPRESAILTEIAPGNYTAIIAGKSNGVGNGLVEIYALQ
jgi:hypothetical protein